MQGINFCNFTDNIIDNNRISHAYLFELNNYDTDYASIIKFVKMLFCKNRVSFNDIDNCKICNICNLIDNFNYPDFFVIEPDGKEIKKSQLLWLREEFQNKSILGLRRIYLIKYAEKMNLSAANSMLKFLEEPSEDVIAILLTTNRFRLLPTIVSRCQYYKLEYDSKLQNVNFDEKELLFLKFLINKELFQNYNYILEKIFVDKENMSNFLKSIDKNLIFFIENNNSFSKEHYDLLNKITIDEISNYIYIFEDVIHRLNFNVNLKLTIDYMFSKLIGGEMND